MIPLIFQLQLIIAISDVNPRSVSRTAAASKVELFVMIVNGFHPLIIITKSSILDVAAVLDPCLNLLNEVRSNISVSWVKETLQKVICSKRVIATN